MIISFTCMFSIIKRLIEQNCIKQRPSGDPVHSCAPHTSSLIWGGVEMTPALTLHIITVLLTFCSDTHAQVKTFSRDSYSHISTYILNPWPGRWPHTKPWNDTHTQKCLQAIAESDFSELFLKPRFQQLLFFKKSVTLSQESQFLASILGQNLDFSFSACLGFL